MSDAYADSAYSYTASDDGDELAVKDAAVAAAYAEAQDAYSNAYSNDLEGDALSNSGNPYSTLYSDALDGAAVPLEPVPIVKQGKWVGKDWNEGRVSSYSQ